MLHYALIVAIVALVAGLFGFGGLTRGVVDLSRWMAMGFIVLAVLALIVGVLRGR